MLTQDQKEIFTSYALSFIEAYKVVMATLLSIFVPQFCEESGTTCTLKENFSNLSRFNTFVIVYNFLNLGLFIRMYFIQNKRETYLITHLDSERTQAVSAFEANIKTEYPKIYVRVCEYNTKLKKLIKITAVNFILNVIFSCVLVFYYFYDGFRTVTVLIANVLLVASKLSNMWDILSDCTQQPALALSTYRNSPIGYNVIDPDYKTQHSVPPPGSQTNEPQQQEESALKAIETDIEMTTTTNTAASTDAPKGIDGRDYELYLQPVQVDLAQSTEESSVVTDSPSKMV
jgi:hypothetical protein